MSTAIFVTVWLLIASVPNSNQRVIVQSLASEQACLELRNRMAFVGECYPYQGVVGVASHRGTD